MESKTQINPEVIKEVENLGNNKIDLVLSELGLNIDDSTGFSDDIRLPCPIHGGNNPTAFSYNTKFKKWSCWTNGCHKDNNSIYGLIRKILSGKNNKEISFLESFDWLRSLLNYKNDNINSVSTPESKEILSLLNKTRIKNKIRNNDLEVSNDTFKQFPVSIIDGKLAESEYFIDQGFSREVLKKYNVSFCDNPKKPMYMRNYMPVLNDTGETVVGVTGRTIYDECNICGSFHRQGKGCPQDNPQVKFYPKWLHFGFKKSNILYNSWFANKHIKNTGVAILTEGPKEVLWYEQHNICNSVSIFGLTLSSYQLKKLISMGTLTLVVGLDNDERGLEAIDKISELSSNYFKIINIKDYLEDVEDIDELSEDKMNNNLIPFLKSLERKYGK
jgi:hypothetical protein